MAVCVVVEKTFEYRNVLTTTISASAQIMRFGHWRIADEHYCCGHSRRLHKEGV